MLKRYYSLDEALAYLSEKSGISLSHRDLFDHILTERLRICVWYSGSLAKVQKDDYGFGYECDTILGFYMFRGYLTSALKGHLVYLPLIDGTNQYQSYYIAEAEIIEDLSGRIPQLKEGEGFTVWNHEISRLDFVGLQLFEAQQMLHTEDDDTDKLAISVPRDSLLIPVTDLDDLLAGKAALRVQPKADPQSQAAPKYTTRLLQIQAEAIQKFWVNFDPAEPDTAPSKDAVIGWLTRERGCYRNTAEAIDMIIRHDSRKKGGRTS